MFHWLVIFFLVVVMFHIIYYKKFNAINILFISYLLYIYYNKIILKTKIEKETKNNMRKKIRKIIDSFFIEKIDNMSNNDVKVPKRYRYIFIKPELLHVLHRLSFVRHFNEESYMTMFVVLERFYKVYYNIIIERYDLNQNKDRLKAFYENMKEIKTNMIFSVPKRSRNIRGFESSLDIVISENIDVILANMKTKINLTFTLNK
jgi:hypothetical protein